MNFFENIDWEKYHEIALERANKDKRPDFPEIPDPVLTSVEDMEEFIKHQVYLDYIWLNCEGPLSHGLYLVNGITDSDIVYTYPGKI